MSTHHSNIHPTFRQRNPRPYRPLPLATEPRLTFTKAPTLAELASAHPKLNDPLIDGLARRAEVMPVISETKIGKSWLLNRIALTCATGGKLFDRFQTTQGRVLYLDNELHGSVLQERIYRVGDAMGLQREQYEAELSAEAFRSRRRGGKREKIDVFVLGDYLNQYQPGDFDYVILDALYRFWPAGRSENDNAHWVEVMNTLEGYAERLQATFLLVHHSSKGDQSGKRVTDVGAGGGALSRAADCHLVLRQHTEPGVVVVDAAVRSFAPIDPFCLRWTFPLWQPADDCDPSKLRKSGNRPAKPAKGEAAKPNKFQATCDAAWMVLRGDPDTMTGLRKKVGMSGAAITDVIQSLLEEGRIVPCQVKTGGARMADTRRLRRPRSRANPSDLLAVACCHRQHGGKTNK